MTILLPLLAPAPCVLKNVITGYITINNLGNNGNLNKTIHTRLRGITLF